jgi:Mg-chelatase subunit ChlD
MGFPFRSALCLVCVMVGAAPGQEAVPGARSPWESGEIVPIVRTASNRAVTLTVVNAALSARYGSREAAPGRAFLIVATEWVNHIPLVQIKGKNSATAYMVPDLRDQAYLVADGTTVWQLDKKADGAPGVPTRVGFTVSRPGEVLKGNLIFDVPAGAAPASLAFRFYDFAHGHMAMDLVGSLPQATPKFPPQKNEVIEAAVYDLRQEAELQGSPVPPGMRHVVLDLRGRSTTVAEADASAFDPHAAPGAKVSVGTVADWKESDRYLHLVVDGEYAYAPRAGGTLPGEPRFLPDLFTGGTVSFLIPENPSSVELCCEFPNAKSSLSGKTFRPRGLTLEIEGARPKVERKAIASLPPDDCFRVSITGQAAADEFAGEKAGAGRRFLILDVTVENAGQKGEFFQTPQQLKVAGASGKPIEIDAAAAKGPRPPMALLWIPIAARRSFQVVYGLPAAETKPRLLYAGLTLQKTIDLPPLEGAPVAAAAPDAPAAPAAVDKPAEEKPMPPPAEKRKTAPAVVAGGLPPLVETVTDASALKPPHEPRGLAGVGVTADQVNEAIDRAAAFLWDYIKTKDIQEKRLKFGDVREHTLAALALIHAGAHRKFPDFDAQLKAFLGNVDSHALEVYQAGIRCMVVESYGDPSLIAALRRAALFLLELQGEEGSWSYSRSSRPGMLKDPADEKVLIVAGGIPLDGTPLLPPLRRNTDWKEGLDGDNSTSQYALLGLQAASRSGVRSDLDVWRRSLANYRSRQGGDGNWYYNDKAAVGYGSMTCAGICSVAITRSEIGEEEPARDPAILHGLDWLAKNFALAHHPGMSPGERWKFYYLYSLERVGRILGVDFIGQHEWYPEGVKHLLSIQKDHGGWEGNLEEADPRLATSFALLFLTRATAPLDQLKRNGDGTLRTGILLPRTNRYYIILDASGSMTGELDGKTKWDIARNAVGRLIDDLPDTSEVALRVYGHRKRAIEPGADEDTALELPLRKLVKKDFLAKLEQLRCRGKTPLARSLLEAARDLAGAAASGPVTVILLTDGGEDTLPRQDPRAAAVEFGKVKGVRLHVVGFDIGREDWSKQLQEIATRAEGHYWPALKAESLYSDLRSAVFGTPRGFAVSAPDGKEAGRGSYGDALRLHEGKYVFRTEFLGDVHEETFWINTDATTSVVFNAARVAELKPTPRAPSAAAPPTAAPAAKFCAQCGAEGKPAAKFCSKCGTKFP